MDKKNLKISLSARCNAAGRPNNEDNFQVSSDLASDKWQFVADEVFELGSKGILLVACDGMGGMNAGEVASEIAVETIKTCFASSNITDAVISSDSSIRRFVIRSIQTADAEIKRHGEEYPETSGMGSTIVLVWIYGQKAYVGWCGDSRVYRFNLQTGIERLSHDHSYVQELVDAGKLSEDLAFDHPNSNIITRSLGDPHGKAKPDFKAYDIHEGDIFLLCSDGLCGTLRDEEISAVMAENTSSMQKCCDALWAADEQAGWTDNVTTVLAKVEGEIVSGLSAVETPKKKRLFSTNEIRLKKKIHILTCIITVFLVASLSVVSYFVWDKYICDDISIDNTVVQTDTITSDDGTDTTQIIVNEECRIIAIYHNGKKIGNGELLDTVPPEGGEYLFDIQKNVDGEIHFLCDKYVEMISKSTSVYKNKFSFSIKENKTQNLRDCKISLTCNNKILYYFKVVQRPCLVSVPVDSQTVNDSASTASEAN